MEPVYSDLRSLPTMESAFADFVVRYPRYCDTAVVDDIRNAEYAHLDEKGQVCLDYTGVGLFSQWQQSLNGAESEIGLAYTCGNLATHAMYADAGTTEGCIRRRILRFMNISDKDYCVVFTASSFSALKLVGESFPFHQARNLLLAYDHQCESLDWIRQCASSKRAVVDTAALSWPGLSLDVEDLKRKLHGKKRSTHGKSASSKGLFVFPFFSRLSGRRNSLQWILEAKQNGWHVLLDICSAGAKTMDSLGLLFFLPEFIICSFYKVFGHDPSGLGCLLIKRSVLQILGDSSRARSIGMVRIVSKRCSSSLSRTEPSSTVTFERLSSLPIHTQGYSDGGSESTPSCYSPSQSNLQSELLQSSDLSPHEETCQAATVNRIVCWSAQQGLNQEKTNRIERTKVLCRCVAEAQHRQSSDQKMICVGHCNSGEDMDSYHPHQRSFRTGMPLGVEANAFSEQWKASQVSHLAVRHEQLNGSNVETLTAKRSSYVSGIPHRGDNGIAGRTWISKLQGRSMKASGSRLHMVPVDKPSSVLSTSPLTLAESASNSEATIRHGNGSILSLDNESYPHFPPLQSSFFSSPPCHHPIVVGEGSSLDDRVGKDMVSIICRGLDHADQVGLTRISFRQRSLVNWLISSLLRLRHCQPKSKHGHHLVVIYGPQCEADRGATVAFNLFDSCGTIFDPRRVQKLADRSNISLRTGILEGTCNKKQVGVEEVVDDNHILCGGGISQKWCWKRKTIQALQLPVVYAALGFLSSFSDVYKLWMFVAQFLDSDFIKQEVWHYRALNQQTILI